MKKKPILTRQGFLKFRQAYRRVSRSTLGKLVRTYSLAVFATGVLSLNVSQAQNFTAPATNPFGLTPTGTLTASAAVDLDNDGDLDLLVNEYSPGSGAYGTCTLKYYQNTGTSTTPVYGTPTAAPFGITNFSTSIIQLPHFADMDNDGDQDLLLGVSPLAYGSQPSIKYMPNTGTATAPAFGPAQNNPFGISIPIDLFVLGPTTADMDNDGDIDLMLGTYAGSVQYYQNTGTAAVPAFAAPVQNPGGISPSSIDAAFSTLADFDNDGDTDLLMSSGYGGNFEYFENTGTTTTFSFALPLLNPFGIVPSSADFSFPTAGDFDSDGDTDFIAGSYYGNLFYYENTGSAANQAPVIDPVAAQTVCAGSSLVLNLTVTDPEGDSLSLSAVSADQNVLADSMLSLSGSAGSYILTISPLMTSASGNTTITLTAADSTHTTTVTFPLTLLTAPEITGQPADQQACAAGTALFAVASPNTTGYQWYHNGNPVSGATSAQFPLSPVAASDSGFYYCELTNGCGTGTHSDTVGLAVMPVPSLAAQSGDTLVCQDASVWLSVTPEDTTAAYTYQWLENGTPIQGATSPAYFRQAVLADSGHVFQCLVGNSCDTIASTPIVVGVEICSAVDPQNLAQSVRVYPNPARQAVTLDFSPEITGDIAFSLVNAFGQTVFTQTLDTASGNSHLLSWGELPAGVYRVRIAAGSAVLMKTLVIE